MNSNVKEILDYFSARSDFYFKRLSARRSVTETQATLGAVRLANQDVIEKYGISIAELAETYKN